MILSRLYNSIEEEVTAAVVIKNLKNDGSTGWKEEGRKLINWNGEMAVSMLVTFHGLCAIIIKSAGPYVGV